MRVPARPSRAADESVLRRDQRLAARAREIDRSLDLRPHRAGRQLGQEPLRLVGRQLTQLFGALCPEGAVHRRDLREDQQPRCAELPGEERRRSILVDDGVDALELSIPPGDGNPTPATRDGDCPAADQRADRVELDDLERGGGGDDAPKPAARVLHELPAPLPLQSLRLVAAVEGADRLRRPLEGVVTRIDHDVGEQTGDGSAGGGRELALDQGADFGLCLGDGEPERQRRHLVGSALLAKQLVSDLGAVPVRDDDVALAHERRECPEGVPESSELLCSGAPFAGPHECVAAERDDEGHANRSRLRPARAR